MKTEVRYFISYTRLDEPLPERLLELLQPHFAISRRRIFIPWQDTGLLPGEDWDAEIQGAIASCQLGLALLSPGYFSRPYITKHEIPPLTAPDKVFIPLIVKPIDLKLQDLQGLERLQLFRLGTGRNPRTFSECSTAKLREEYAFDLYRAIEARLDKALP